MKIKTYVKKKPRVEMMPLIDTMFLLLVFFIYAMLSMVIHKGVDVSLPQSANAQIDRNDYQSISITAMGEWFWNKDPVPTKQLNLILKSLLKRDADPRVYIRADRDAKHEWVMDVMNQLRQAGINKMFFETDAS